MNANERQLVHYLLDGWEGALHNMDILFQVVQQLELPDLAARVRHWEIDHLRIDATLERFEPVREAAEAVLEGRDFDLSLQQSYEKVNRSLT